MEPTLSRQALSLLLALGLGAALAAERELLSPAGRRRAAAELFFALSAGCALFLFAMGAGDGRLGLWETLFAIAGFSLCRPAFRRFGRALAGRLHKTKGPSEGDTKKYL